MTTKPTPSGQEKQVTNGTTNVRRWPDQVSAIAAVVATIAAIISGFFAWSAIEQARQANVLSAEANEIAERSLRMASQLVSYDVVADEEWNLTLRHVGGADVPLRQIWVTPHFADDGLTGYIEGPERAVAVPPPESGVTPTTYRIAQVDEQVCAWTLHISCDERPLKRIKLRYEINGEPTSQYVSAPGSGS